jgi:hypothetical protein
VGPIDKFDEITKAATYTLVLLANEATGDWVLLEPEIVDTKRAQTFHERGLCFGGILAIVNGAPRIALEADLDSEVMSAITAEFLARVGKYGNGS